MAGVSSFSDVAVVEEVVDGEDWERSFEVLAEDERELVDSIPFIGCVRSNIYFFFFVREKTERNSNYLGI